MNTSDIPSELWLSIFERLSPKDTVAVSAVNRHFRALGNDSVLWKGVYVRLGYPEPSTELIKAVGWKILTMTPHELWDTLNERALSIHIPRLPHSCANLVRKAICCDGKNSFWVYDHNKIGYGPYPQVTRFYSLPYFDKAHLVTSIVATKTLIVARTQFGTLIYWKRDEDTPPVVSNTNHGLGLPLKDELSYSGTQTYAKAVPFQEGLLGLNAQVILSIGNDSFQIVSPHISEETQFFEIPSGTLLVNSNQIGFFNRHENETHWHTIFKLNDSKDVLMHAATLFKNQLFVSYTLYSNSAPARHYVRHIEIMPDIRTVGYTQVAAPYNKLVKTKGALLGISFYYCKDRTPAHRIAKLHPTLYREELVLQGPLDKIFLDIRRALEFPLK
jgi:hypothetical protein